MSESEWTRFRMIGQDFGNSSTELNEQVDGELRRVGLIIVEAVALAIVGVDLEMVESEESEVEMR